MVSEQSVKEQLDRLDFKAHSWGRSEIKELPNILLPDEEIYDLVIGLYEGGFALLVATDTRLLLIDKKPLNYLTVEDLRFDMINEIDYSHRLVGAQINIATGGKNLRFRSYNQPRLRKVIGHVQHCMAQAKKRQTGHLDDQRAHLEQINQLLQAYLIAQHHQQVQLSQQLTQADAQTVAPAINPVKPPPELADYLYAQSLLAQYRSENGNLPKSGQPPAVAQLTQAQQQSSETIGREEELTDLYNEGTQEIFGKHIAQPETPQALPVVAEEVSVTAVDSSSFEINPFKIARAKLPMALRNRKFGRPLFHAHSKAPKPPETPDPNALPEVAAHA